jgi:hypothetical protein
MVVQGSSVSAKRPSLRFLFGLWVICLLLLSCASTASSGHIDGAAVLGNYEDSLTRLEKQKNSLYRKNRDMALYYLDAGMLSHYAGRYGDSSRLLEDGERAIEAAFTKSVSETISSFIVNDTVKEYAGEDYEDVYINVFNALNYYHRGSPEDALVEIRRMNNKLQYLAFKYGNTITSLQKVALENSVEVPFDEETVRAEFSNSALGRYLGMLFYRGEGLWDDARIDLEGIRLAFANQPSVYAFPPPASLDEELNIPPGKARMNIISFSGLSPVKQEEMVRIPIAYHWIKIALPSLHSRPSLVSRIEAVFDSGELVTLELIEDIDAIARETFKQKRGMIYLRSILRSVLKTAASVALDAGSNQSDNDVVSMVLGIFSLGAQLLVETEKADLRISRYFPGRAHVGGITLDPGLYSFDVLYYDYQNRPLGKARFENVPVYAGRLNLTEAVCLQ